MRNKCRPRLLQSTFAQVCCEDLNRYLVRALAEILEQRNRDRVDLLAGGAARNPDTDLAPLASARLCDPRKDDRVQRFEYFGIA